MKKEDLRIVFMGTPEFAVGTLSRLVEQGYNVVACVTQPDKPVGRHQDTLQPSQVKRYAQAHGIPVLQPVKMKDPVFLEQLAAYRADVQVVVAFRMLPEAVWSMPRFGTFNVHAALLPQYRGAAPINWAIINGERQTGVTTFFLDHDIDTGRIILQDTFDIPDDANVEFVYDGLMEKGANLAIKTLDLIIEHDGLVDSISQAGLVEDGTALHNAPKLFKDTCRIDWSMPAKAVHDFIRGLSPVPGAWTEITQDGKKTSVMKIYKARKSSLPANAESGTIVADKTHLYVACGDELLELLSVQLSGKKCMEARDFLNGFHDINQYHCK